MRGIPQTRPLMIYMAAFAVLATIGCVKSSETPPAQETQVEGVPAPAPAEQPAPPHATGGLEPTPEPGNQNMTPSTPPRGTPNAKTPAPAPLTPAPAPGNDVPRPVAKQPAPKPAPPAPLTVAEGTEIPVRTVQTLSSKTAENGTRFEATLSEPLMAGSHVVAPKGARVNGVVSRSDDGGRVKGVATLTVTLTSIEVRGKEIEVNTTSFTQQAKASAKKDALKVGVASGIGAAIGAIAGGGKGAAIGAGAGAGAGTGVVLATKGEAAVIPSESPLTFKLTQPLTVARN
ncbi:MAG: hypothetical protein IT163_21355 [Bryobacterales bacterium]|nr:hypothetical protein [Bryobacterales bacterium]